MTLRELRASYPDLFHPNQDWFDGEPFMDQPPPPAPTEIPVLTGYDGIPPEIISYQLETETVPAVVLASLYVQEPDHPIWMRYLWTSDLDRLGQRVYVGENGKGLEIHRHLHITDRWGVPTWP
jgi:hypothetical protein